MPEDAPVNIGAMLAMPFTAGQRVLGIQTKLHGWAAADPGRRFDDLFNLVVDPAFMAVAWTRVRENKGARTAGVDKCTAQSIEASAGGVEGFLEDLRLRLKSRIWRPLPVRQRKIPKAGGKFRRLGIPAVADRVVQACLKLVLEPIFESDFHSCSYGFRPGRRAQDAIEDIRQHAHKGYEWVFEGDIAACFDEISHTALMNRVRERIGDKRVLALVKAFLLAGVMDEAGERKEPNSGAPQGGILSPLLANIALSALDEYFTREWERHGAAWNRRHHRRRGGATYRLVRYADDFVVLVYGTRAHAEQLWSEIEKVLATVGLRLAVEKTRVVHLDEGFDFLGFRVQRHRQWGSDRRLVYSYPSKKAQAAIRRKVKEATPYFTNQSPSDLIRRLGQITRGWCLYFRHGASKTAFQALENYMWHRVWTWLRNKHPGRHWKWVRRKYYPNRGLPEVDGVRLFDPGRMAIQRHPYRGHKIPTPWSRHMARQTTT